MNNATGKKMMTRSRNRKRTRSQFLETHANDEAQVVAQEVIETTKPKTKYSKRIRCNPSTTRVPNKKSEVVTAKSDTMTKAATATTVMSGKETGTLKI